VLSAQRLVQNIFLEFALNYSGIPQKMSTGNVDILAQIKNGSLQNNIQKRSSLSRLAKSFVLTPNKDVVGRAVWGM
jgi:hypothetical protein